MNKIELNKKTIMITGSAGFIGSNLVLELLGSLKKSFIIGIDNMNDYYDPELKRYRLELIEKEAEQSSCKWEFVEGSIADKNLIDEIFKKYHPSVVVNLAAQAGVRYSIANPDVYIESNVIGFLMFLKPADTHMMKEEMVWSILYMQALLLYTEGTIRCRLKRQTLWIILFHYMRHLRNPMN